MISKKSSNLRSLKALPMFLKIVIIDLNNGIVDFSIKGSLKKNNTINKLTRETTDDVMKTYCQSMPLNLDATTGPINAPIFTIM
jgi:predicted methyltransferase MtxX (methanogen marker protein 4)